MPAEPFRFVQAADLHLELPVLGLAEVPDHLRAALIDVPYVAAERVFDTALAESADFLVLSGDVLDVSQAGPRALAFLLEQFERLAARDVAVYWAGGQADPPEHWPPAAKLPPNVHVFSKHEVEEITHYRHEEPLCRVSGLSAGNRQHVKASDFHADENGLFTIVVAHGRAEAEALAARGIDYWALGGHHQRQSLMTTPHVAHYCGTTQGRSPDEFGPHGCTLVSVDVDGAVRTQLVATDAVRWHAERLAIGDDATPEELRQSLAERMRGLAGDSSHRMALVQWTLEASGPVSERSRSGWIGRRAELAVELTDWLREEFGNREPLVWTGSLEFAPLTSRPKAWTEEDTILGDFLRAVQVHETDARHPLDVSVYLSPKQREGELSAALALADEHVRRQALLEAAALGVELLRGEGSQL